MSSCLFSIQEEELSLLPERAIYWAKQRTLIVSDVHLGKAGHFRKHGIPISRNVHVDDLRILSSLIATHQPQQVILLGDLFHSAKNNEWKDFLHFLSVHDHVQFTLIEGNHDILTEYPTELRCLPKLIIEPFSFTHIQEEDDYYNLSGHLHPGVMIRGKARQGLVVPCYLFGSQNGILPAFGQFTGVKKVVPKKEDQVFVVAENNVIALA